MKRSFFYTTSIFLLGILLLTTGCTPSDAEKQAQKMETQQPTVKNETPHLTPSPSESKQPISSSQPQATEQYNIPEPSNEAETIANLSEQTKQLDDMKAELDYYKQYVKEVTITLSPEKLLELVKKEWKYSATINGVQFPTSGVLDIQEHVFKIVFTEEGAKYSVLPDTESQKGRIASELASAVSTTLSPIVTKENNITSLTYEFKELKEGNIVSIHINDELKTKLNLATNELIVKVVK